MKDSQIKLENQRAIRMSQDKKDLGTLIKINQKMEKIKLKNMTR